MKLLSVVWYKVLPATFGGQKGIALFNRHLAAHASLVCLCSRNNEPADEEAYTLIPSLPESKAQMLNPLVWWRIVRTARKEKITHIILEHPYHGIAGWLVKKLTGAKLIIHSHNIEHRLFRERKKMFWPLLKSYEKWTHRRADLNLFKTTADLETAIRLFGLSRERCHIVPYGVEVPEKPATRRAAKRIICNRHQLDPDQPLLLFAGTLDYEPNARAVEMIFEEIAPRLQKAGFSGRILICGRNRFASFQYLHQLSHPLVMNLGEVPDIDSYFRGTDVFINPVGAGGGVQTKIIDALAQDCPVVCFASLVPEQSFTPNLLAAADHNMDAFTACILAALQNTAHTPPSFFDYYDWKQIAASAAKRIATC